MFEIRVSLNGIPAAFDHRVTGADLARVVAVEKAVTAGLKTLNDAAEAGLNGAGAEVPADAKRVGSAKLTVVIKKDGKPFADGGTNWHDLTDAHAKFIGEAFAGLDDASAKG